MLRVVLASREDPHEITEIHSAYLILKKETYMLSKINRSLRVFYIHQVDVILLVLRVVVPNPWKEGLVYWVVIWCACFFVIS